MAKVKKQQTKDLVLPDQSGGGEIVFSPAQQAQFHSIKDQIKSNLHQIGLCLRDVRDHKYYLIDDCQSFNEWLIGMFGNGIRTAQRMLEIADAFGDMPNAGELMDQSVSGLLALKKDPEMMEALKKGEIEISEGHVILPGGETVDLPSFIRSFQKKVEQDSKGKEGKLKSALNNSKEAVNTLNQALNQSEDEKRELHEKINSLEKTLQDVMGKKDLDGMRIAFVTHRDEASELLDESFTAILDRLGQIDNIPPDLVDAKLAGHMGRAIAGIDAAIERLRDRWSPIIYTHPGEEQRTEEPMVP